MKKWLDSDWLRTVQFFLNTVQKRSIWMQKKVIKQAFWLVNEQRSWQQQQQQQQRQHTFITHLEITVD